MANLIMSVNAAFCMCVCNKPQAHSQTSCQSPRKTSYTHHTTMFLTRGDMLAYPVMPYLRSLSFLVAFCYHKMLHVRYLQTISNLC